jgi:hypothetical protein
MGALFDGFFGDSIDVFIRATPESRPLVRGIALFRPPEVNEKPF